jgi:predicted alpha/beta superfamily hydrolase
MKVLVDFLSGDRIPYDAGGDHKFLDVMKDELTPSIEKIHPVTHYRTFVGYSFGWVEYY